jgi:N-acetylneuraminate synthase
MISKFKTKEPVTICEIGCNHKGDLNIAKEMIKVASEFCGVDVVKFQKRNNKTLLSKDEYNSPHPVPENSYGNTYGEHREFLEFSIEDHEQLKKECEKFKVIYSTSVWDLESAKETIDLNPKFIKIPSAMNTNFLLLKFLCQNFAGKIHLSLSMTTIEEEKKIVSVFKEYERLKDLVLYHCISAYPVENDDLALKEINRLDKTYSEFVDSIGFSGHHKGIAADIAALTLGANFFERHFTLDRTWKGTDHAASLEPDGMRRLVRDLKSINKGLSFKNESTEKVEEFQRKKLKKLIE